jgi:hypothetical protein
MSRLSGGCFCGHVRYTVEDHFQHFFLCFCDQCRKLNGSSHGANLFGHPSGLAWEEGEDNTARYKHPDRIFTRVFCKTCGTSLPYVSGEMLIVPAASLDDEPTKTPDLRIFCSEQPEWYKAGMSAPERQRFRE